MTIPIAVVWATIANDFVTGALNASAGPQLQGGFAAIEKDDRD
jgi:hypothetical protein